MKTLVMRVLFAGCEMTSLKDIDIDRQIILKCFSLLFIWLRIRT